MLTTALVPALFALLLQGEVAPQDPSPPQTAPSDEGPPRDDYMLINGVAAFVNDRAITMTQLGEAVSAQRESVDVTTRNELEQLQAVELERMIESELRTQAGQDLGFPSDSMEYQTSAMFDYETEARGRQQTSDYLAEEGLDKNMVRADLADRLYLNAWIRSQVGIDPAPAGRVIRSRSIRPGELWMAYQENLDYLGEPDTVRLQQMVILGAQAGSLEDAHDFADMLRTDVAEGRQDLAEVIRQNSPFPERDGVLSDMSVNKLPADLRIWVDEASPGDLSTLLPYRDPSQPSVVAGWGFFRLLESQAGEPPAPFGDREVQSRLSSLIQRQRDEHVLDFETLSFRLESETWNIYTQPNQP